MSTCHWRGCYASDRHLCPICDGWFCDTHQDHGPYGDAAHGEDPVAYRHRALNTRPGSMTAGAVMTTGGFELAELVLLFHGGGPWTQEKSARWAKLTGDQEATTKTLGDAARSVLAQLSPFLVRS